MEVSKKEEEVRRDEAIKKERIKAISEETEKRQRLVIIAVAVGLLIVIVFSFFLYKRFKITERQKSIIEKQKTEVTQQKHIVEEKNKEITDSITYAKRLQAAILPPMSSFKDHFSDAFVLYRPKDIVAGDFFWKEVLHSGDRKQVFFAVADCTGHGVPGAMVSVVCSNALNRAVNEFGIIEPGKILDKVTDLVLDTFSKGGEEVRDGMDISLGVIHFDRNELHWAGANNPICIIRNGEMTELKADKQPVGKYLERKEFTTKVFDMQKDDCIYLFSDGYGDQFGGEISSGKAGGKKFKESTLKKYLLEIHGLSMDQQSDLLWQKFIDWKGDLEQIDDVCVMGLRV